MRNVERMKADDGENTDQRISSPPPSTLHYPLEILRAARPAQWTKNLLVYAAFLFTLGHFPILPAFLRATLGVFLFILLSTSAYLLNDIRDVERDRLHPRKRFRPIAAGRLPVSVAAWAAVVTGVGGLVGAWLASPAFFAVALLYVIITLSYSTVLKHIVLLDVMTLAAGYVVRAVAGAVILSAHVSFWLVLCTLLLALFLGLCKRRGELMGLEGNPTATRAILGEYTVELLDQMISVATASALITYALYTYYTPTGRDIPEMWLFRDHLFTATVPFVVYGIYRYLYLVHRHDLGSAPETVFLRDRPLQINTVLWVLTCLVALVLGRGIGTAPLP